MQALELDEIQNINSLKLFFSIVVIVYTIGINSVSLDCKMILRVINQNDINHSNF